MMASETSGAAGITSELGQTPNSGACSFIPASWEHFASKTEYGNLGCVTDVFYEKSFL